MKRLEVFKINVATHEHFFDSEDTFGQADGFNVAAAIASYDDSVTSIVKDENIGSLKFYLKSWV